jgi:hypothetical protein
MAQGDISLHFGGAHSKLATLFYQVDEKSIPNRELYGESLHCLNSLAQYRRLRIFAGNNTVPPIIWLVLLAGGLMTVLYTYCFGMQNIKAQCLITASLTVTISLILFLIYVLDRPFTGASKVSTEPLRQVLDVMQKS